MRLFFHYTQKPFEKSDWRFFFFFLICFLMIATLSKSQNLVLQSFSPTANNIAPVAPTYTLTFDRNVVITTSTAPLFSIRRQSDGAGGQTYNSSSLNSIAEVSGNTVTIKPFSTDILESNTAYYVLISANMFLDANNAGIGNTAITSSTTWQFSTRSNNFDRPGILSRTPSQSPVAPNGLTISITFDEPIHAPKINFAGAWSIQGSDGSNFNCPNASLDASRTTLTLCDNIDLQYNVTYQIILPGGAPGNTSDLIYDDDANGFVGVTTTFNQWVFTTEVEPDPAPTLVSSVPVNGQTDVTISIGQLEMTLSENVVAAGTGSFSLRKSSDNSTVKSFQVGSADVTISSSTVTLNNVPNLDYSTSYYVYNEGVANSTVEDSNGSPLEAINASNWSFTTEDEPDTTSPTLVSSSPANGATNVAVNINQLQLTLSEDVFANGTGYFNLNRSTNNSAVKAFQVGTENVTISGNTITLNDVPPLDYSSTYWVYHEGAANSTVSDASGNPLEAINATKWSFTTEAAPDSQAPSLVSTVPSRNSTVPLGTNIVLTFDEGVQKNTSGTFSMYDAGTDQQLGTGWDLASIMTVSGDQATITIPGGFISAGQSVYFVLSGGIEDLAGNAWAGSFTPNAYTLTFEQPGLPAPSVAGLSPKDDSKGVSVNLSVIKITFDEAIQLGSGSISIKKVSNDWVHQTATPSSKGILSVAGKTLTMNLSSTFEYDTEWYVTIDAGLVEDLDGNAFTGISDKTTWTFTIETAPVAPNAPSTPALEVISSTHINVSFTDNASDESGFEIQRSTSDTVDGQGNFTVSPVIFTINEASPGTGGTVTYQDNVANSGTDNAPKAGQTYYYRVRAFKN